MRVPRSKIVISDRPICNAISHSSVKIKSAPTLSIPGPQQRFSANLVASYPVKWFLLDVRMLFIFYKKMLRSFSIGVTAGHDWIFFFIGDRHFAAMSKLPHVGIRGWVIHVVFYIATSLE